jgi:hypothetical protein
VIHEVVLLFAVPPERQSATIPLRAPSAATLNAIASNTLIAKAERREVGAMFERV